MNTYLIHITGLVQGVGFRPFVYRVARAHRMSGEVENNNEGVFIRVNSGQDDVVNLIEEIRRDAPVASRIDNILFEKIEEVVYTDFIIVQSENLSEAVTGVSPDIAVCADCLEDIRSQANRIGYPFTNCTNCGPRFSIIRDLPYDREKTTMDEFEMCEDCRKEYEDVSDRRFHAQPVACNNCGPTYSIHGSILENQSQNKIIRELAVAIDSGLIAAVKGMGGFHLLCDATNEHAVAELRARKRREGKPFAVMCKEVNIVKDFAEVSDTESDLLLRWERPVVILSSKKKLAFSVSNGLDSIGIILPYMPIHYTLLEYTKCKAVVFTSANISDEPTITDNCEAVEKLTGIADIIITYNRKIHNRSDDSVARVMAGKPMIIRRSRGYSPSAIKTQFNTEGIFAAGAELVNAFSIGKGSDVILSQYIGDLKNQPTYDFYNKSYLLFKRLFRFSPSIVVKDLHPDYLSSRFAERLSIETGAKVVEIQHHHAHVVSCMAENRLDDRVIGLSLDGVGLGSDGNIWGGEILLAGYTKFERLCHFDYVPILGADKISSEPWRSAVSYLHKYGMLERAIAKGIFRDILSEKELSIYINGIDMQINTHLYSSAGRLFDAVSSLTGINHKSRFHAEAPMRLEAEAHTLEKGSYSYNNSDGIISFGPTINEIVEDIGVVNRGLISAKFHNTICHALADAVDEIALSTGVNKVVLTGGTFQNFRIITLLTQMLEERGKIVYLHGVVPPNDNGIALGQIVAAAAMREQGII